MKSTLQRAGLLTAVLTLSLASTVSQARTDDTSKPVLLVHGYDVAQTGLDCSSYFSGTITKLKAMGYTKIVTVGYYSSDRNCSVNLRSFDSTLSNNSTWKQIGKAFAAYVNQTYTSTGQVVDAIGHSMGGLIIRGAIQGGYEGLAGFQTMMIEDAVTIATPHQGATLAAVCLSAQCRAMQSGSADLKWLATNGNPQSLIPTDWTVTGSSMDGVVSLSSAMGMTLDTAHKAQFAGLTHMGILSNDSANTRAGNAALYGNQ